MSFTNKFTAVTGTLILFAAPLALAEGDGPQVTYSTGVFYTTGKYGYDEATDIIRIPFGASLTAGRVTLFGELPWLSSDGPAGAVPATRLGTLATAYPRLASRIGDMEVSTSADGFGDATLGGTMRLTPAGGPTWAGLTVLATVPTGDEDQGLGTGTTDWSAEGGLERRIGGLILSGAAGYTWLGDTDDIMSIEGDPLFLEDYAYARIGLRHDLPRGGMIGTTLGWSESADPALDDVVDAAVTWGRPVSGKVWLGTYVSAGLAGDGNDFGAGISLSFTP